VQTRDLRLAFSSFGIHWRRRAVRPPVLTSILKRRFLDSVVPLWVSDILLFACRTETVAFPMDWDAHACHASATGVECLDLNNTR